jgi:ribosomal-protein-alanine N-acetyltransferase
MDEAEINNVAVAAEWRSKGLGKALMLGVLDMARLLGCLRVNLEVRQSNAAAIAVYEKCGFKAVGLRPGYYEDNHEDAVLMSADLLQ